MDSVRRERQLLQLLVRFTSTLVSDHDLEEELDALVTAVSEVLGVSGAGIMLEDDEGELRFVSASDDVVRLIERFQVETGEGPCVLAYETGTHVRTPDLSGETPFPRFAEVARRAGLAAVHSFPMAVGGVAIGALNLYRDSTGPLPEDGVEVGQLFADLASAFLHSARRGDRLAGQVAGLQQRIEHQGVIDQAKGVLRHQLGVDDREAFGLLRRRARADRRRVLQVSEDVMAGRLDVGQLSDGT